MDQELSNPTRQISIVFDGTVDTRLASLLLDVSNTLLHVPKFSERIDVIVKAVLKHTHVDTKPQKYYDELMMTMVDQKPTILAGQVHIGHSLFRAPLFKYICDHMCGNKIRLPVSLHKNEYGESWCSVTVVNAANGTCALVDVDMTGRKKRL